MDVQVAVFKILKIQQKFHSLFSHMFGVEL